MRRIRTARLESRVIKQKEPRERNQLTGHSCAPCLSTKTLLVLLQMFERAMPARHAPIVSHAASAEHHKTLNLGSLLGLKSCVCR